MLAQGIDASIAQIRSLSEGFIDVGDATTDAITDSSTAVTIGRAPEPGGSGSVIVATGDISVTALGMSDADSSTQSTGRGFVTVSSYSTHATATPEVATTVESDTFLKSDGLISITAEHNVSRHLSDGTFYTGGVNPLTESGVDGDADTITFRLEHGFRTDSVVTYTAPGAGVGGLQKRAPVRRYPC